MASKVEVEIEMKTDAEKMWKNLKERATFFPKALPDMFEGIDVLEGDGNSVGSVLLLIFKQDLNSQVVSTTKEKIEIFDEEKKTIGYRVLEGESLKHYKNYRAKIAVSSKGDGAIVKYSAQFDKANEQVPDPKLIGDFAVNFYQALDAYLLKN